MTLVTISRVCNDRLLSLTGGTVSCTLEPHPRGTPHSHHDRYAADICWQPIGTAPSAEYERGNVVRHGAFDAWLEVTS